VKNSPFQATVDKVRVKGRLSLDLSSKLPEFRFKIDSTKVNIGLMLAELNIAEGIDATVDSFGLDLNVRGRNLGTILDRSEFAVRMKNGKWTLKDPNTGADLEIRIIECVVKASAGQPVIWSIDGRIKDEPVKIEIKGDRLAVLAGKKIQLPLNILAEAAEGIDRYGHPVYYQPHCRANPASIYRTGFCGRHSCVLGGHAPFA